MLPLFLWYAKPVKPCDLISLGLEDTQRDESGELHQPKPPKFTGKNVYNYYISSVHCQQNSKRGSFGGPVFAGSSAAYHALKADQEAFSRLENDARDAWEAKQERIARKTIFAVNMATSLRKKEKAAFDHKTAVLVPSTSIVMKPFRSSGAKAKDVVKTKLKNKPARPALNSTIPLPRRCLFRPNQFPRLLTL